MDRQSIIILSGFGLLIIGGLFWQFSDVFNRIPVEVKENEQIPNELVCMVNDAFMGVEQIPVEGEKVNKANAFITLRPGQGKGVYYFISEKNMRSYFK